MPLPFDYQQKLLTPFASRNIEASWTFQARESGQEIVLPDARCDLIVNFNIERKSNLTAILTAPSTQSYAVHYGRGDAWIGMRLRPEFGAQLWRGSKDFVANAVLRGGAVQKIYPELSGLAETHGNVDAIENILASCVATSCSEKISPRVSKAVNLAHFSGGRMRTAEIANLVGCTQRQLTRLFHLSVGLTTKDYLQIVQFHRALSLIRIARLSAADAALEAGYADQAHLTRTFRRFGGFTPLAIPANLAPPILPNV